MLISVLTSSTANFSSVPFPAWQLGRKAMTEAVTAFLIFVSIGVFLAHAFDAYRLR